MTGKRTGRSEQELAELAKHRDDPTSPEAQLLLRRVLEKGSSFAVAIAAKLVGEAELADLADLLAPAYQRIANADPGCGAKTAIVEALCRLERDEPELFLHATRCVQLEKAWGPPVDTAAQLRAHGGMGLACMHHPDAPIELARLLADKEWTTRAGAARALACASPEAALPLLTFKAAGGDPEPEVIGECLRSLLALAPARMVPVVAERLDAGEEVAEQAALALGDSRLDAAFAPLRDYADRATGPRRRAALLAMALLRSDAASAYLMRTLADAPAATAAFALEALAVHKHDPRVRAAVLTAVRARGDQALIAKAEQALGD